MDDTVRLSVRPLDANAEGSVAGYVEVTEIMLDIAESQKENNPRLQIEAIKRAWALFRRQCSVVPPATDLDEEIRKLSVPQFRDVLEAIQGGPAVPLAKPTPLPAGRAARATRRTG